MPIAALAAGAIVSGLMASGLLALLADSAQVTDGRITSAEYDADPPLNIEIAPAPSPTSCEGAVYQTDDVISFSESGLGGEVELDLKESIEVGTRPDDQLLAVYCVRNASGDGLTGELSATLLTRSSAEIGLCGLAEQQAEVALGGATCTRGEAAGELTDVIAIELSAHWYTCGRSSEASYATFFASDPPGTTKPMLRGGLVGTPYGLLDGEDCIIKVQAVGVIGSSSDEYLAAVTDSIDFSLAINLVGSAD
ncbi:MAG: hypothetical protein GY708_10185 [Actinomycetia bacterium]|nr:hypothetical protein [Actinomycetes bacterium]